MAVSSRVCSPLNHVLLAGWSCSGAGVLVQTHTDVDATGTSYYGGTGLYLLHGRGSFENTHATRRPF